ncbi:MAG TPA: hypothetical protein VGE82_03050 [Nitrososphaera sp.]|jgi:hypothetical protein
MYAKLCNVEILPSYIKEIAVGDVLTVQALITNPLDWHHFYEKISTVKIGDRTEFTVVTGEGDRVIGSGNILEVEKWSNRGQYGFKIKLSVKKQKSLTDRRRRGLNRVKPSSVQAEREVEVAEQIGALAVTQSNLLTEVTSAKGRITTQDMNAFQDMLQGSLALDMTG